MIAAYLRILNNCSACCSKYTAKCFISSTLVLIVYYIVASRLFQTFQKYVVLPACCLAASPWLSTPHNHINTTSDVVVVDTSYARTTTTNTTKDGEDRRQHVIKMKPQATASSSASCLLVSASTFSRYKNDSMVIWQMAASSQRATSKQFLIRMVGSC
jgi:hypothetical protein